MNQQPQTILRSAGRAGLCGIKVSFVLSIFYGAAFSIIAIPGASIQILTTLSLAEGMLAMLLSNAVSIFILATQFAIAFGLGAALIGGVTFALVDLITQNWLPRRGMLSGLGLAALVAVGLHLLFGSLSGIPHAMLFRSFSSYLFWLGLPCLLFIAVTTWFGAQISTAHRFPAVKI